MALTLAAEAASLASAQGIVSTESADADRLAWASTNPGVDSAPIQDSLLGYLQATRKYEWRGHNAAEGVDPATQDAIATLERVVEGPGCPEVNRHADLHRTPGVRRRSLQSDRRARLASASRELPGLYVVTLAVSGAALILNASVLTLRGRPALRNAGRRARSCGRAEHGPAVRHRHAASVGAVVVSGQPINQVIRDLQIGIFPHVATSADACL